MKKKKMKKMLYIFKNKYSFKKFLLNFEFNEIIIENNDKNRHPNVDL